MSTAVQSAAGQSGVKGGAARWVWYELHTSDAGAATEFYGKALGWGSFKPFAPGKDYTLVTVEGTPVGGVLQKPAEAFGEGAKAGWMGYIGVSDVDAFAERVVAEGGVVHRATEKIPMVGSFAVVADPQGAIFVLFQPQPTMARVELPEKTPGTFAWHDLAAADWESDYEFYAKLFGWSKGRAINMGEYGTYQIFEADGVPTGGMMNRLDKNMRPWWLFYMNVEDIDAAIERVKAAGGSIAHGPSTVATGEQIAHCLDTQGAMFGMVAPAKG